MDSHSEQIGSRTDSAPVAASGRLVNHLSAAVSNVRRKFDRRK